MAPSPGGVAASRYAVGYGEDGRREPSAPRRPPRAARVRHQDQHLEVTVVHRGAPPAERHDRPGRAGRPRPPAPDGVHAPLPQGRRTPPTTRRAGAATRGPRRRRRRRRPVVDAQVADGPHPEARSSGQIPRPPNRAPTGVTATAGRAGRLGAAAASAAAPTPDRSAVGDDDRVPEPRGVAAAEPDLGREERCRVPAAELLGPGEPLRRVSRFASTTTTVDAPPVSSSRPTNPIHGPRDPRTPPRPEKSGASRVPR